MTTQKHGWDSRRFTTKREAQEFAGSLSPEWYWHIYKGHRAYVVQFYNPVEAYRQQTAAPVERETETV
jgi:hypothetical protein